MWEAADAPMPPADPPTPPAAAGAAQQVCVWCGAHPGLPESQLCSLCLEDAQEGVSQPLDDEPLPPDPPILPPPAAAAPPQQALPPGGPSAPLVLHSFDNRRITYRWQCSLGVQELPEDFFAAREDSMKQVWALRGEMTRDLE